MPRGHCWVCDQPVDSDPCPTCGTALYVQRADAPQTDRPNDVLDTGSANGPGARRNPVVLGIAIAVALVVLFLLFRSAAVIS